MSGSLLIGLMGAPEAYSSQFPHLRLHHSSEWQRGCFNRREKVASASVKRRSVLIFGVGNDDDMRERTRHRLWTSTTRLRWASWDQSGGGVSCSTFPRCHQQSRMRWPPSRPCQLQRPLHVPPWSNSPLLRELACSGKLLNNTSAWVRTLLLWAMRGSRIRAASLLVSGGLGGPSSQLLFRRTACPARRIALKG